MPQKRVRKASGKASLSAVIDRPEVLDASKVCAPTCGAILA